MNKQSDAYKAMAAWFARRPEWMRRTVEEELAYWEERDPAYAEQFKAYLERGEL